MKFQYIKIGILGLALTTTISSCSDTFLSTEPSNYIPEEEAITTSAAAEAALNGAYDALRSGDFYGGSLNLLSELAGDHVNGSNLVEGDWKSHYNRLTNIFQGTTRNLISNGSKAIGRCNNLLRWIDGISDLSETDRNRMKAECKFLKAICWFEQVRMFAQPYGFTGDVNGNNYTNNEHPGIAMWETYGATTAPRETVAAVYTKITQYLTEAANELPATNGVYANKYAAYGYLAKVYFQMNDFQKAYDAADKVISESGVSFDPTRAGLTDRYSRTGCTEAVFQLVSTSQADNSGSTFKNIFTAAPGAGASIYLSDYIYNKVTNHPGDVRDSIWMKRQSVGANSFVFCKKFFVNGEIQVPLIHITEMKLIRAEAAAELNNLSVAEQDLTDIRNRAGETGSVSGASQANLISIAREERETELIFENSHFHDMRRISIRDNQARIFVGDRESDRFCPGLVCQFPDNELKGNPDFEANPQGSCN